MLPHDLRDGVELSLLLRQVLRANVVKRDETRKWWENHKKIMGKPEHVCKWSGKTWKNPNFVSKMRHQSQRSIVNMSPKEQFHIPVHSSHWPNPGQNQGGTYRLCSELEGTLCLQSSPVNVLRLAVCGQFFQHVPAPFHDFPKSRTVHKSKCHQSLQY